MNKLLSYYEIVTNRGRFCRILPYCFTDGGEVCYNRFAAPTK